MSRIRLINLWFWLSLFSIAMGFMESAVVVYIREILYPHGFNFPLASMDRTIANTEMIREMATLIMLMVIGYLGGRNSWEKFAWFIYCFAIWDIFYYLFLKLLINWPDSLFTWDVLFLIPVTWTGPVIAPVILSLTMVFMAWIILYFGETIGQLSIKWHDGMIIVLGSILVFLAFIWDYSTFLLKHYTIAELFKAGNYCLIRYASQQYVPHRFNWFVFLIGEFFIMAGLLAVLYRYLKIMKQKA
jgi:hypothetical protein